MKKLLLFLTLALSFSGCDCSTGPSLEERFSCKIDGKLFVADKDDNTLFGSRNLTIDYYINSKDYPYYLTMTASSGKEGMSFGCDSVIKINTPYPISSGGYGEYRFGTTGTIVLTNLDTAKRRMIGVFTYKARERGGTKFINITEGEFNSEYILRGD